MTSRPTHFNLGRENRLGLVAKVTRTNEEARQNDLLILDQATLVKLRSH